MLKYVNNNFTIPWIPFNVLAKQPELDSSVCKRVQKKTNFLMRAHDSIPVDSFYVNKIKNCVFLDKNELRCQNFPNILCISKAIKIIKSQ